MIELDVCLSAKMAIMVSFLSSRSTYMDLHSISKHQEAGLKSHHPA